MNNNYILGTFQVKMLLAFVETAAPVTSENNVQTLEVSHYSNGYNSRKPGYHKKYDLDQVNSGTWKASLYKKMVIPNQLP